MKTETILNILDVAKDKIAMSEKDAETIEVAKLEITTLVSENKRLRDALTALFEWGRSHISPTHNPDGHAAMLLAYEALNPKGNNQ